MVSRLPPQLAFLPSSDTIAASVLIYTESNVVVPKYKRVLLKLGGEALAGPGGFGIDPGKAKDVAAKV